MISSSNVLIFTITAAALTFSAAAATPDKGTKVTFNASGTFASQPVSGNDTLKLAGQPFSISIVAKSSDLPANHGRNWAVFTKLTMTGTVYSGLLPGQAIPVSAKSAEVQQTAGASEDIFVANFPVTVVGIPLHISATIVMPGGTMTKPLIRPFPAVSLDPSNSTVIYSNTTASTTLTVESGTLQATTATGGDVEAASARHVLSRGALEVCALVSRRASDILL